MSATDHKAAAIVGVGLRLIGYPTAAAWRAGERDETPPKGALIERRSRRRCSPFTKALAEAYGEALDGSGLAPAEVASVFGSALGEVGTMIKLLDTMWVGEEPMSPMAFAMSVHNAASGVVSISTANRGYTTSIGADHDTPAMALYEALGLLAAGAPGVMVTCGDDGVPVELIAEDDGWPLAAAAVALAPVEQAPDAPRIGWPTMQGGEPVARAALSARVAENPSAGMIDLVDAVLGKRWGTVALDRGAGSGWSVELWGG